MITGKQFAQKLYSNFSESSKLEQKNYVSLKSLLRHKGRTIQLNSIVEHARAGHDLDSKSIGLLAASERLAKRKGLSALTSRQIDALTNQFKSGKDASVSLGIGRLSINGKNYSNTREIILREKEFGEVKKENKATKRKYELEKGKNVGGAFEDFNLDNHTNDENSIRRFRIKRKINNESDVENVDQAINYRSEYGGNNQDEKYSHNKNIKNKEDFKKLGDQFRKDANDILYNKDSEYRRKLKINNAKRNVRKFVKDNKVALGVAGGAALVGGGAYLIHRHNKKKKEAKQEKENNK